VYICNCLIWLVCEFAKKKLYDPVFFPWLIKLFNAMLRDAILVSASVNLLILWNLYNSVASSYTSHLVTSIHYKMKLTKMSKNYTNCWYEMHVNLITYVMKLFFSGKKLCLKLKIFKNFSKNLDFFWARYFSFSCSKVYTLKQEVNSLFIC